MEGWVEIYTHAHTRTQSKSRLLQKAQLYDKLKRGEVDDPNKHGFLVDFNPGQGQDQGQGQGGHGVGSEGEGGGGDSSAGHEGSAGGGSGDSGGTVCGGNDIGRGSGSGGGSGDAANPGPAGDGDVSGHVAVAAGNGAVEISDEFGRVKVVTKRSREHLEFEERERLKRARQHVDQVVRLFVCVCVIRTHLRTSALTLVHAYTVLTSAPEIGAHSTSTDAVLL